MCVFVEIFGGVALGLCEPLLGLELVLGLPGVPALAGLVADVAFSFVELSLTRYLRRQGSWHKFQNRSYSF